MCALAVAHYVWNDPYHQVPKSMMMNVEYRNRYGEYKLNKYELSDIRESSDKRELSAYIIRGGGGISCTITIRRNTTLEGAELEMSHSQNHVSGLREVYGLMKEKIIQGRHYNSLMYRNFEAEQVGPERKKLKLRTEVKQTDNQFKTAEYDLEITSVS